MYYVDRWDKSPVCEKAPGSDYLISLNIFNKTFSVFELILSACDNFLITWSVWNRVVRSPAEQRWFVPSLMSCESLPVQVSSLWTAVI